MIVLVEIAVIQVGDDILNNTICKDNVVAQMQKTVLCIERAVLPAAGQWQHMDLYHIEGIICGTFYSDHEYISDKKKNEI